MSSRPGEAFLTQALEGAGVFAVPSAEMTPPGLSWPDGPLAEAQSLGSTGSIESLKGPKRASFATLVKFACID
jgi:hypothetical protein